MFGYELYYDGLMIREVDDFETADTEEEAMDLAIAECNRIAETEEGYEGCTEDDFDINIIEIEEEEED